MLHYLEHINEALEDLTHEIHEAILEENDEALERYVLAKAKLLEIRRHAEEYMGKRSSN